LSCRVEAGCGNQGSKETILGAAFRGQFRVPLYTEGEAVPPVFDGFHQAAFGAGADKPVVWNAVQGLVVA
jgi:hypothetical protein